MSVGLSINQESLGKFKKRKRKFSKLCFKIMTSEFSGLEIFFYVKLSFKRFMSDSNAHSG